MRPIASALLGVLIIAGCTDVTPEEPPAAPSFDVTADASLCAPPDCVERIVFWGPGAVPGPRDIFSMNPDGSEPLRVADTPTEEWGPALSPDGQRIAFYANDDGTNQIYVMDVNGGNRTRIANVPGALHPAWSPDGSQMVYTELSDVWDSGPRSLVVMNADGSGRTVLDAERFLDNGPGAWSADGSSIAYSKPSGGSADMFDIYVVSASGGVPENLTDTPDLVEFDPAWSPDGSRIAYAASETLGHSPGIYTMNADGSGAVPLTAGEFDVGPVWSPDGSKIAFDREFVASQGVYRMNADGSALTQLTSSGGDPHWGFMDAGFRNQSPHADAGPDRTVLVGVEVQFDGSGSSDPDGEIASWAWDFGDGETGTGESTAHVFGIPGAFTVTLRVMDDDGASAEDEAAVTVQSPAEGLDDAYDFILALELNAGIEQAISAPLAGAINTLDSDVPATINQIEAAIAQTEAQRGNKLTEEQADAIKAMLQDLITSILATG